MKSRCGKDMGQETTKGHLISYMTHVTKTEKADRAANAMATTLGKQVK